MLFRSRRAEKLRSEGQLEKAAALTASVTPPAVIAATKAAAEAMRAAAIANGQDMAEVARSITVLTAGTLPDAYPVTNTTAASAAGTRTALRSSGGGSLIGRTRKNSAVAKASALPPTSSVPWHQPADTSGGTTRPLSIDITSPVKRRRRRSFECEARLNSDSDDDNNNNNSTANNNNNNTANHTNDLNHARNLNTTTSLLSATHGNNVTSVLSQSGSSSLASSPRAASVTQLTAGDGTSSWRSRVRRAAQLQRHQMLDQARYEQIGRAHV